MLSCTFVHVHVLLFSLLPILPLKCEHADTTINILWYRLRLPLCVHVQCTLYMCRCVHSSQHHGDVMVYYAYNAPHYCTRLLGPFEVYSQLSTLCVRSAHSVQCYAGAWTEQVVCTCIHVQCTCKLIQRDKAK